MKKSLLITIAFILTFKPFAQDIEKITIKYSHGDMFNESGNINTLKLIKQEPSEKK